MSQYFRNMVHLQRQRNIGNSTKKRVVKMGSRNVRKTHNEHLKNAKVAAEYINHALATEDVAIILMAIRNVVDAQDGCISGVAERSNLGRESMNKMLSSNGNPKLTTLSALFHGLGLKMEVAPAVDGGLPPSDQRGKGNEGGVEHRTTQ